VTKPAKVTDGTYVITVRNVAGPAVRAAFDDVTVSAVGDTTVLQGAGTDPGGPARPPPQNPGPRPRSHRSSPGAGGTDV